jgi:hypothetical protein
LTLQPERSSWDEPVKAIRIPVSEISRLETRHTIDTGKGRSVEKRAYIGAGVGLAFSLGVAALCSAPGWDQPQPMSSCVMPVAVRLVPIGAVIGMGIGALNHKHEDWMAVPIGKAKVSLGAGVAPGVGWKAGVSVGF